MKNYIYLQILAVIFCVFLSSCSKPGDISVRKATQAAQKQDFENAEKLYLQALQEESNYSKELIWSLLANMEILNGDNEKAAFYLEKSMKNAPDYRLLVTLATLYSSLENDAKAEETLNRAIELEPQKGEALAQLGSIRLRQKRYKEAAELLEKAEKIEPRLSVIPANLGIAYAKLGDKEKSEKAFSRAQELKCENLQSFRDRAFADLP